MQTSPQGRLQQVACFIKARHRHCFTARHVIISHTVIMGMISHHFCCILRVKANPSLHPPSWRGQGVQGMQAPELEDNESCLRSNQHTQKFPLFSLTRDILLHRYKNMHTKRKSPRKINFYFFSDKNLSFYNFWWLKISNFLYNISLLAATSSSFILFVCLITSGTCINPSIHKLTNEHMLYISFPYCILPFLHPETATWLLCLCVGSHAAQSCNLSSGFL